MGVGDVVAEVPGALVGAVSVAAAEDEEVLDLDVAPVGPPCALTSSGANCSSSFGEMKVYAVPLRPARPVRPMRCT